MKRPSSRLDCSTCFFSTFNLRIKNSCTVPTRNQIIRLPLSRNLLRCRLLHPKIKSPLLPEFIGLDLKSSLNGVGGFQLPVPGNFLRSLTYLTRSRNFSLSGSKLEKEIMDDWHPGLGETQSRRRDNLPILLFMKSRNKISNSLHYALKVVTIFLIYPIVSPSSHVTDWVGLRKKWIRGTFSCDVSVYQDGEKEHFVKREWFVIRRY